MFPPLYNAVFSRLLAEITGIKNPPSLKLWRVTAEREGNEPLWFNIVDQLFECCKLSDSMDHAFDSFNYKNLYKWIKLYKIAEKWYKAWWSRNERFNDNLLNYFRDFLLSLCKTLLTEKYLFACCFYCGEQNLPQSNSHQTVFVLSS